jgi:chromosome segregation ATPase
MNEMEAIRTKIETLKAERDKRIGMIEQAKNEIESIRVELSTKGLDEETLDNKIDILQKKESELKAIISKRITECEKLIENQEEN